MVRGERGFNQLRSLSVCLKPLNESQKLSFMTRAGLFCETGMGVEVRDEGGCHTKKKISHYTLIRMPDVCVRFSNARRRQRAGLAIK